MQEEQQNTEIAKMQMERKKQHEKTREKNKNENNVQFNTKAPEMQRIRKVFTMGKQRGWAKAKERQGSSSRPHGASIEPTRNWTEQAAFLSHPTGGCGRSRSGQVRPWSLDSCCASRHVEFRHRSPTLGTWFIRHASCNRCRQMYGVRRLPKLQVACICLP